MSFGKSRPLGLRTKLTLWSSLVLAASLAAGFLWVHFGLRSVITAKTDTFLEQKAAELSAVLHDSRAGGTEALKAEIQREVTAYEAEGLVVVARWPGTAIVTPRSEKSHALASQLESADLRQGPETRTLPGSKERYRVLRIGLGIPDHWLGLALSLSETESTLAQFDARVGLGGLAFVVVAALGGMFLSRQALRPVAMSIRTARGLNPENLSARLPRTGAEDELDELAGTINSLLDRLAAYHAQVTRFTADASHELRSPLAAMRAAIEVALGQPREVGEYREVLSSLGEQCDRLTSLVNGLLLLARADAGEVNLECSPLDLAALGADVVEMYEPLAEERGVCLSSETASPVSVIGDASRIQQLVTNLVDNAIKFTGPGGSVTLQVQHDEASARLIVQDTGEGIATTHLPHVFERFYQASPARSAGGYGLGLSICRWIVGAHGGDIHVRSTEGLGTTFTVTLPRADTTAPSLGLRTKGPLSAAAANGKYS
jgi:heavy metal sensor kinase